MTIIKRDGTPQDYNFMKIADAVSKAFSSVNQSVPEKFLEQVKESVEKLIIKNNGNGTPIEQIPDFISFFQNFIFDIFNDRLRHPVVSGVGDDEIVDKRGLARKIDHFEINGLFFIHCIKCGLQ